MFYIYDKTEKDSRGGIAVKLFSNKQSVINHLEKMAPKILGKNRQQLMSDAADLGFGDDDREGKNFYMFLSEYVNMGVIRDGDTPVRCNIFTESEYRKSEYGD
ncbi:MAG: hypothetical protein ACOCUT_04205 [bacterium]